MQLEEEERKQKEAENTAGWLEQGSQGGQVMDQPQQLNVSDLKPTELKYYQVQNENPFCDSQTTTELDAESPTWILIFILFLFFYLVVAHIPALFLTV